MRHLLVLGLALAALAAPRAPAAADTVHVFAAGSLSEAVPDLIRHFPAAPDSIAPPEFGPSGLLRQRLETTGGADLLLSADMDQPHRLAAGHPERMVVTFTRNRLCAIARQSLGMTSANMLDKLLDPGVRVGTSTPGADPGGDYAWAMFARADAVRPGARAALEAKALKLVGGGAATPPLVPGKGAVEGVFLADRADVMLGYCSAGPAVEKTVPGLVTVALPDDLRVGASYGMVVLSPSPAALRFALFVMSEAGQAVLAAHGFDPVAPAAATAPQTGVMVQWAGHPALWLTPERLAALPAVTETFALSTEAGAKPAEWSGPLLWNVLAAAGAVDAAKPMGEVRRTVRVTGSDGYYAVFGLAELAPDFAGRPILLARSMNGAPLPGDALRLVVPGEHRGGRSVRDVLRIDLD